MPTFQKTATNVLNELESPECPKYHGRITPTLSDALDEYKKVFRARYGVRAPSKADLILILAAMSLPKLNKRIEELRSEERPTV